MKEIKYCFKLLPLALVTLIFSSCFLLFSEDSTDDRIEVYKFKEHDYSNYVPVQLTEDKSHISSSAGPLPTQWPAKLVNGYYLNGTMGKNSGYISMTIEDYNENYNQIGIDSLNKLVIERDPSLEFYRGDVDDFWIEEGKPLGQFYGYKYDGVYTTDDFNQNADGTYTLKDGVPYLKGNKVSTIKPGDVKYKTTAGQTDANGNPVWSTDDRTVIGSSEPKFTGGMVNTFMYKGFDLSVFFTFSSGNEVFNMNAQRFIGPYLPNQNSLSIMNDRFALIDPATGKETTSLARLAELNPNQYANDALWSINSDNKIAITDALDYYLEDASFLRLNTITLGYSLPKPLLKKAWISNARLYFTLNNIHTFTNYSGYDPEVSSTESLLTRGVDNSAYPRSKSYVIGLNLTF